MIANTCQTKYIPIQQAQEYLDDGIVNGNQNIDACLVVKAKYPEHE